MKLPEKPKDWRETLSKDRREFFKPIRDEELFKKIIDFNKRHLYWDELKYRLKDKKEQERVWALMKFLRVDRYEEIPFKPKELKFINLSQIIKLLHKIDKFSAGNIELDSNNIGLQEKYIISSLMEEAIASSMIEGAATTRKAAKRMLKEKIKPKNKNEQMVLNGYETMQMIVKRKNEKLTPELLLEIQTNITKDTLDEESDVGKLRDNNEIIVGDQDDITYHTPPDYKKVNNLIEELCKFANNDEKEFIHPIIKGIILHFLIGYIHPFNDGNGRTARSVFYWYVLSRGYWLFEYLAVSRRILLSKKNYEQAYLFTEYDEFDLTYFIKYNLEMIDFSLSDLIEYIKIKQTENEKTKKIVEQIKELNFRQANILKDMMKRREKTYSIGEICEVYGVVYQTARTDLLKLKELGYVDMRKVSKRFLFKLK